ncbi:(Fe-S)-binding protein [Paenibacillus humicola]|uniref:(Fe-S)-binding protein n=1 Tax=Paenibacillus humicola TaxID=3110540 RepID=UPI00237A4EA1|nr:(Fe-S)-binding protein [Paenibacillus humicola]
MQEIEQLARWLVFAAMTAAGLWMFGAAVGRRIGYIRLGRSSPPPAPRRPGNDGPEDEIFGEDAYGDGADGQPDSGRAFISAAGPGRRRGRLWPEGGYAKARRAGEWAGYVFGHRKLLKDIRSGILHLAMFYGFIVLQFGAADIIWKGLSGSPLPLPAYGAFVTVQEWTVLIVLLAVLYAAFRRYGERLRRLKRGWKPAVVLWFIGGLMATVLLTQAFDRLREAALSTETLFAPHAFVSSAIAQALREAGVTAGAARALYELFWWLHYGVLLAFLVYVPQSKHFHLFTAPVNIWLRRRRPPGALAPVDLEDESAETFGAGAIEHFTRKQLLDLYACVECGRCTNVCPASGTGKLLSPMHLIVKLRDHLTEKGAALTHKSPWVPAWGASASAAAAGASAHAAGGALPVWAGRETEEDGDPTDILPTMKAQRKDWRLQADTAPADVPLIGGVMTESELWSCTTCRSCEEQCPVGNEHVDKIVEMRRHLVLMEGRLPAEGQRALQHIERQGNPWGLPRAERVAWIGAYAAAYPDAPPVVTMQEAATRGERPELLLWAGSMGAYDQRSRKVLFAVIRLLQEAGVPFAVLGREERSSGDTARRMGNELLFQTLCRENIDTLERYGVRRIVTICPHTFNALKNEYPDFGLDRSIAVEHHTTLLDRLVAEGRLRPAHRVAERVAYHDSCYLGRYNGVYDAPRRLLRAIPGIRLLELERSRQNGMCCGAGGGLMWMEEQSGMRVSTARVSQALAVRPSVIGSACPYCLTMMEDGVKQKEAEDRVRARDVAELLAESVFGGADGGTTM